MIENNEAIATCNTSLKANQMGRFWILINKHWDYELKYEVCDKEWKYGNVEGSKATVLLDLIETTYYKTKYIMNSSIVVFNDKKLLLKSIREELLKINTQKTKFFNI